ncbi:MAG: DAK2 domain-containing protein [Mycetocola sp.]
MTRLFNDPATFADEMIDGFVAANSSQVRRVRGGVVRSTASKPGSVAVVVGGGSGHYPAFGGLVGQGLAHRAAMGNLFAVDAGVQAAKERILTFGAVPGDKTMVDSIVPFADTLSREIDGGERLAAAWAAADASTDAAAATADLLPRMGRARPHAEKSLGTPDAGAHSLALIVQRITTVLTEQEQDK